MGIKFANNASTNITHALTADATSVSVTSGTGDLFPSIVEGKDYFYATLAGNNGLEIVKVTKRVLDTMTVERAQDGTSALIFHQGDLFELRIVAADFEDTFSQVDTILEDTVSHVENTLEDTVSALNTSVDNKMSSYLPLSGGVMEGEIRFPEGTVRYSDKAFFVEGANNQGTGPLIQFNNDSGDLWLVSRDLSSNWKQNVQITRDSVNVNGNPVLTSAGGAMTGTLTVKSGVSFKNSSIIHPPAQNSWGQSAIGFYDANNTRFTFIQPFLKADGTVELRFALSADGTKYKYFILSNNVDPKWNGNSILTSAGGTMTGILRSSLQDCAIASDADNKDLVIFGGSAYRRGSYIKLIGKDNTQNPGHAELVADDGTNITVFRVKPDGSALLRNDSVLTTAYSSTIAGYAMPSARFVDLSIGAPGAIYTAPANGYYVLDISVTATDAQIWAGGNYWFDGRAASAGNIQWTSPACKKGDSMALHYVNVDTSAASLRFVYAEGDK